MSDPLRTNSIASNEQHAEADAERDAKIESLLLTGLDHYFSADYAQAIDVWTRALFLDRGQARARAYIERARSALAKKAGVGTAAVQMAHAMGGRVFATASSDDKLRKVKTLGADVTINYSSQDFLEEVKKNTDGKGVDLVLESAGGAPLAASQARPNMPVTSALASSRPE